MNLKALWLPGLVAALLLGAAGAAEKSSDRTAGEGEAEFLLDFSSDKSRPRPASLLEFQKTVKRIGVARIRGVEVVAHADSQRDSSYNMALGERRAGYVKDKLVSWGVSSDLIHATSCGEHAPRHSNKSKYGLGINRQAVITFNFLDQADPAERRANR